jgi:hypothetical protein
LRASAHAGRCDNERLTATLNTCREVLGLPFVTGRMSGTRSSAHSAYIKRAADLSFDLEKWLLDRVELPQSIAS